MSFQHKLMAAMVALVFVVTWVVLGVTERKVETAYSGLYEERYEGQIDAFRQMQEARMTVLEGVCEKAADADVLIDFMRQDKGKGAQAEERESLKELFERIGRGGQQQAGSQRRQRPAGRVQRPGGQPTGPVPLVCVISGEGSVVPVLGIREDGDRKRFDVIRKAALQGTFEEQGVLYLAADLPDGGRGVREVIVTPVFDGEERLGTLLVGADPKGTAVGRMNSRMNRGAEKEQVLTTGIVVGGEFYGNARANDDAKPEVEGEIASEVEAREEKGSGAFVLGEGDRRRRVHYQLLNEGSGFPEARYVALYSLAPLDAELAGLRKGALGAGAVGLALAILLGYVLARALSVPVRELSNGTEAVARGELEARVPVRGGDELGRLAGSFNEMAEGLAMKEKYRSVLGKVADEAVAEALVAGELELGGEEIEVSILFCDIRGFTSMSEGREPSEVIALLNEHMTAMTEVVYQNKGVVDKFVGDEIMAIFGAPKTYGDDAGNACKAALAMIEQRARLNESLKVPVAVGIGIATGVVVAGCMGSETRLNYTVVGDKVNLAARLCSAAKAGEVIVDGETWGRTEGLDGAEEKIALKGFTGEVSVWRLGRETLAPV